MRYQGGKSRISKDISEEIINAVHGWKESDKQSDYEKNPRTGGLGGRVN